MRGPIGWFSTSTQALHCSLIPQYHSQAKLTCAADISIEQLENRAEPATMQRSGTPMAATRAAVPACNGSEGSAAGGGLFPLSSRLLLLLLLLLSVVWSNGPSVFRTAGSAAPAVLMLLLVAVLPRRASWLAPMLLSASSPLSVAAKRASKPDDGGLRTPASTAGGANVAAPAFLLSSAVFQDSITASTDVEEECCLSDSGRAEAAVYVCGERRERTRAQQQQLLGVCICFLAPAATRQSHLKH